ncbi:MAG: N-acetylglucosamine kinase [Phototrophicaceae bacterium]
MQRFIGIDGGGSNLRVVVTDEHMNELIRVKRGAVNPSAIGREQSAYLIQSAIQEALDSLNLKTVTGVGIGVAGASAVYAEAWLRETIETVLPDTFIAPASDNEIALVGGAGKREGLLLLAGTGSVGFGMNTTGEKIQVGGWGYILGDEGSGFWIGLQALKTFIDYKDADRPYSPFVQQIDTYLKAHDAKHLVEWVYVNQANPVPVIARVAELVLDCANDNDPEALAIVHEAVSAIVKLEKMLVNRLKLKSPSIIFAGGILTSDNVMSRLLLQKLALTDIPHPKYEPVIGAALLAKLCYADTMSID